MLGWQRAFWGPHTASVCLSVIDTRCSTGELRLASDAHLPYFTPGFSCCLTEPCAFVKNNCVMTNNRPNDNNNCYISFIVISSFTQCASVACSKPILFVKTAEGPCSVALRAVTFTKAPSRIFYRQSRVTCMTSFPVVDCKQIIYGSAAWDWPAERTGQQLNSGKAFCIVVYDGKVGIQLILVLNRWQQFKECCDECMRLDRSVH